MKVLPIAGVVLIWAVIGLMLRRGNLGTWGWVEVVGLGIGSLLILIDAARRRQRS